MSLGSFSGNPRTEWLTDPSTPDRDMRLLDDFWYDDPDGRRWKAPAGSVVNGASIPRPLWALVGSPYTDDYRRASVVHDVACADPGVRRAEADRMFYFACRAGGCSPSQARLLYLGVRVGAWAASTVSLSLVSAATVPHRAPGDVPPAAAATVDAFSRLYTSVLALPDDAPFEALEGLVTAELPIADR